MGFYPVSASISEVHPSFLIDGQIPGKLISITLGIENMSLYRNQQNSI
jgi:hypothetical protein